MEQQKFTIPGFRCYEITQDGRVFRKNSDRWIKTTLPDGELKQQIQVSRKVSCQPPRITREKSGSVS